MSEPNLLDKEWLYTLVQAGATFAALVGAFFTTRILAIASEKRTLQNHIDELDQEIPHRKQPMKQIQEELDDKEMRLARYLIERLEDDFIDNIDVEHPPSVDEMYPLFEKITGEPPTKYERATIEERHATFLERVAEEQIEKAEEKNHQLQVQQLEEKEKQGYPFASTQLMALQASYGFRSPSVRSMVTPRLEIYEGIIRRRDELCLQLQEHRSNVAVLEARRAEYNRDLSALAFPKYIRVGFVSLIYVVIATVLIPLYIAPFWYSLPDYTDAFIFWLFVSGLSIMILYLYVEIRYAMK